MHFIIFKVKLPRLRKNFLFVLYIYFVVKAKNILFKTLQNLFLTCNQKILNFDKVLSI